MPAFTAPAAQVKTATFSDGRLTNYKGTKYGFSGYFTTSPLIMTGPGSVTEANAGALNSTALRLQYLPGAVSSLARRSERSGQDGRHFFQGPHGLAQAMPAAGPGRSRAPAVTAPAVVKEHGVQQRRADWSCAKC